MKFLQKILLIVAVGMFAKNVDCMHFADPRTPAPALAVNPGGLIPDDRYVDFDVNGHHIYFPADGRQPPANVVARLACANIEANDINSSVTKWYVKAFGGSTGLNAAYGIAGIVGAPRWLLLPPMGFTAAIVPTSARIVTINMAAAGTPANFDRDFWQTFRIIASDPVGRVLLYRILIEIRRQNAGNGSCENGINPLGGVLSRRNYCRSIVIYHSNDGNSFSRGIKRRIDFDPNDVEDSSLRINTANHTIDTQPDTNITHDMALFHEMLHWFHYLRHPQRYIDSDETEPTLYRYLLRSYYGDKSELYSWGALDDEEIRTILGTPNYNIPEHLAYMLQVETFLQADPGGGVNVAGRFIPFSDRFLEGDDLSENVYRMTKLRPGGGQYKMRFGQAGDINQVSINPSIPERFMLAHKVAIDCYSAIIGHALANWSLVGGEAVQ
jgi:hypothetical protein